MKKHRIRDWMTRDPATITSHTSLGDAHQLMKARNIRRLPIVDDGKLVGIVTLGDIRGAQPSAATALNLYEISYLWARTSVSKVMTRNVFTLSPDDTMAEVARAMLEHKIGGCPVLEHGRLVGVVTESDLFRLLAGQAEEDSPDEE